MRFQAAAIAPLLVSSPVMADEILPALAQSMVDAAAETGDPAQIAAVAAAARKVFSEQAGAVDAYAARLIAALPSSESELEKPRSAPESKAEENPATGGFLALSPWDGKIAASGVFANGNSENLALGVLLDARREAGKYAHNFNANLDVGKSDGVQNLKRWGAAYQLDYKFVDRSYAYGRLAYTEDEFSGFDYRLFAGAGLGHFYYKSDEFTWKVEGGPGFQYSPIDDTRAIAKEFAVYAASEADWAIRDGLKLEQDFTVTWSSPTTTLTSITALTTALTDSISAGLGYEVRFETNPPDPRKKTDTVLRANLAYGF